jgi:hypothetical protein
MALDTEPAGLAVYLASAVILAVGVGIALFMTIRDAIADRELKQDHAEAFPKAGTSDSSDWR